MKIQGLAPAIERMAKEMQAFREGAESLEIYISKRPFNFYMNLKVVFRAGGVQNVELKP